MNSESDRIAALTMVRNDNRFLRKWVDYYGAELGRENLYVYMDGEDQTVPDFCEGVNVKVIPKMQGNVVSMDRQRARMMSEKAASLLKEGCRMVIATDVDEFLVVDPALRVGLTAFLRSLPKKTCYSGLGVDVLQHLASEGPVDFNRPFLSQRRRGWLYSRYTKPSVITAPVTWGSGYHRVKGHDYHIVRDLYLFHFGGVDLEHLRKVSSDSSRVESGWNRHQAKRQRAVEKVNGLRARAWQPTVKWVRRMQTVCRSIFALNKPTTYGIRFVVGIPERFNNVV